MPHKKTCLAACLLAGLLLLAACGSKPAAAVDACSLLTPTDAQGIMGGAVDAAQHPVSGSATFAVSSCAYQLSGGTPLENVTLIVSVSSNGQAATAQSAFTAGKAGTQAAWGSAPVDVPGLGDQAYWVAGSGNLLTILKGDAYLTLSASTQTGDAPTQALLDLAQVVIGRLP